MFRTCAATTAPQLRVGALLCLLLMPFIFGFGGNENLAVNAPTAAITPPSPLLIRRLAIDAPAIIRLQEQQNGHTIALGEQEPMEICRSFEPLLSNTPRAEVSIENDDVVRSLNASYSNQLRVPATSRLQIECQTDYDEALCLNGWMPDYCFLHDSSVTVHRAIPGTEPGIFFMEPIATVLYFSEPTTDASAQPLQATVLMPPPVLTVHYFWPEVSTLSDAVSLAAIQDPALLISSQSVGKTTNGEVVFATTQVVPDGWTQAIQLQAYVHYSGDQIRRPVLDRLSALAVNRQRKELCYDSYVSCSPELLEGVSHNLPLYDMRGFLFTDTINAGGLLLNFDFKPLSMLDALIADDPSSGEIFTLLDPYFPLPLRQMIKM